MADAPLPCCPTAVAKNVRDLDHFYGLDFDLFQCSACGRYWVWGWYEGTRRGAWEAIDQEQAHALRRMAEPQMRLFMKSWARQFQ